MRFDKYLPSPALQPYIKHFVVSEQDHGEAYRVLPGTSLVMGFQYRGSLQKKTGTGMQALSRSGITGMNDTYSIFCNSPGIGTVLVFFTETGASHFFSTPLNELFTQSLALDHFIPPSLLSILEERLEEAQTDAGRIALVEQLLLSRLHHRADPLVNEAVRLITAHNGALRIAQLGSLLHTSESPLEKRFRSLVGATPKKFSSIVRINSVLNGNGEQSFTERGYAAGYFDQAHFIKDFKKFTGETPERFFAQK